MKTIFFLKVRRLQLWCMTHNPNKNSLQVLTAAKMNIRLPRHMGLQNMPRIIATVRVF